MSIADRPLSGIYGFGVQLRLGLYWSGILRSRSLPAPVISIGNLTSGGTGKTPLVAYTAALLAKMGWEPVILSRGYGSRSEKTVRRVNPPGQPLCDPQECGDEAYLLARKLPAVPVIVGRNRFRSGSSFHPLSPRHVFLLDDGYQHLALRRTVNILLIDGVDPFGGGRLMPAGRLREPLAAVARADLIAITRTHHAVELEEIQDTLRRYNPRAPFLSFLHHPVRFLDLQSGAAQPPRALEGERVIALAAIGHPEVFLKDLAWLGMTVEETFLFRDHHPFRQSEVDGAVRSLDRTGARAVITTEKDAVRLSKLSVSANRVLALEIAAEARDETAYRVFLEEKLACSAKRNATHQVA